MAKVKKRGKRRSGTTLKFEIYGIAIILFAIISLAGKGEIPGIGPVGRSFSYIFHFFAGAHYYIIPLVGIYIGLFVMIKRTWPTASWSYRKTGVLLILIAILIHYQINLFAQMYPEGEFSSKFIFNQPYLNLTEYLAGDRDVQAYKLGLGGGFIGALLYTMLHVLFDQLGSRLIVYALFAIGLLCATGWSLADIVKFIQKHSRGSFKGLRNRTQEFVRLMAARNKERRAKKEIRARQAAERAAMAVDEDEEEELDDEAIEAMIDQRQREEQRHQAQRQERPKIVSSGDYFPQSKSKSSEDQHEEAAGDALSSVQDMDSDKLQTILPAFRDYRDYTDGVDNGQPNFDNQVILVNQDTDVDKATHTGEGEHETWEREADSRDSIVEEQLPDRSESAVASDQPISGNSHRVTRPVAAKPSQVLSAEDLQNLDQDIVFEESPPEIPYQLPPFHLLDRPDAASKSGAGQDYMAKAQKLMDTLQSFGVKATLLDVVQGPSVTRYEIQPSVGVTVRKIVSLTDDIALALAAKSIRMEAPIPEKSAIGIEVPNSSVSMVKLREVLESTTFSEASSKLTYSLGRDITGKPVIDDLARMPHLLVAGATGSGKSVCVNGIIVSILYKAKPDEVKFLMIDPKKVELNVYNGIPHLLAPVVTDPRRAALALKKVVVEMEKRYEMFSESKTRNLEGYNEWLRRQGKDPLPFIVVIVDELADLMMVAANDVEDAICRLAQMARASGIHLIIATQRPSVNVITGVIKANIPSRIAFSVSSQVDSRTILDSAGAEKLLGRGDMLFMPTGSNQTLRIQGAFLSDSEVEAVVQFSKEQGEAEYREELVPEIEEGNDLVDDPEEELFAQAVQIVLDKKQASASVLQRSLRIGYNRAARIIDAMEAKGIIGPFEGSKPRNVLITEEEYNQRRMSG